MNARMSKETKGTLLVLLTAFISGFSLVANRFFVVQMDPVLFTAVRALIIGVVFFFISMKKKSINLKRLSSIPWDYLVIIGVIGGGLAFWMFFTGLKMTTSGRAAFLHKTLPLYTILFAYFFLKERVPRKLLFAMIIMLLGVSIMEYGDLGYYIRSGDFLVLLATVLWAVENTLAKMVLSERHSHWLVIFSRMFFGSLVLFSVFVFTNGLEGILQLNLQQVTNILISTTLLLGYVVSWYWGLSYINLSKASTILLLSPIITLFLGYSLLNENITTMQLMGSFLILAGALMSIRIKSEKRGLSGKSCHDQFV